MSITADTAVVNVAPRVSRASFVAYLQQVKSPAAGEAGESYDVIVANKVDPLFALGCFWHESNAATNPQSVDVRYGTMSPGNTRTSRTGKGTIVQTDRGQFVKYASWRDGWEDMAFRLVDPSYVYAQQHCTTPGTIIPKFAPKEDGNDPNGYLQSVLAFMNQHQQGGTMAADDPKATWQVSPNFDAGGNACNLIILHTTEGAFAGSLSWLCNSQSQASAQYIVNADGSRLVQMVREADTAWGAGNLAWNKRAIQIEQEGYEAKGGFSDGLYQTVGELVGRIAKRHNIPLDRAHVIGHDEVPSPDGNGFGGIDHHSDPGPHYDFDRVIALAKSGAPPAAKPVQPSNDSAHFFPETGHWMRGGFYAYWKQFGGLAVYGYPLSEEYQDNGLTVQWTERSRFEWHPGSDPKRFDVLLTRLGAMSLDAAKAANPSAFAPQPKP